MRHFKITVVFDGIAHEWTVERPPGTLTLDVEREFTKQSVRTVRELALLPGDDEDPYEWKARHLLDELDALQTRLDAAMGDDQIQRNSIGIDIFRRCEHILTDSDRLTHEAEVAGLRTAVEKFIHVTKAAKALTSRIGAEILGLKS